MHNTLSCFSRNKGLTSAFSISYIIDLYKELRYQVLAMLLCFSFNAKDLKKIANFRLCYNLIYKALKSLHSKGYNASPNAILKARGGVGALRWISAFKGQYQQRRRGLSLSVFSFRVILKFSVQKQVFSSSIKAKIIIRNKAFIRRKKKKKRVTNYSFLYY